MFVFPLIPLPHIAAFCAEQKADGVALAAWPLSASFRGGEGCRGCGGTGSGLSASEELGILRSFLRAPVEEKEFVAEAAFPGARSPWLQRRGSAGPRAPRSILALGGPPTFFLSFGRGCGCQYSPSVAGFAQLQQLCRRPEHFSVLCSNSYHIYKPFFCIKAFVAQQS